MTEIATYTLTLGCVNTTTPANFYNGKIYSCKITDNDSNILVRNFIPVQRASDNTIGMLDLVENKFYQNAGTGTFIGGNETGVNIPVGIARKIKKAYVGVNNVAKQFFDSDYEFLNYIESTGTQYIDTNIARNINKKYRFIGNFNFSDVTTRQLNGAQGGSYFGVVGGYYQITQSSTNHTDIVAPANTDVDFDITFDCQNQNWFATINNQTINTTTKIFDNIPDLAHFCLFSLNGLNLPCSEKIKFCKIYENDVIIRDLVPAKRKSDNAIGLLDNVSRTFYTNSGTGTFLYG